ncbi:hypothetical protein BDB00DRAFT_872305 [Zychaea mexicana]|uniref:uncharacterized protein n=1 Tax=Zychaea mexicana TaxID=64656 RepID=UPI0022FE02B3|nr:uncharacterized protein BDB00DRAFT_872305 [Zychaea mexicana]KAI9493413.1 hypothetical protein BDB00DRAFT_872305 [Zychaea mexicana]
MAEQRRADIVENLTNVRNAMQNASSPQETRLVAVSKYKPAQDLLYAYEAGQRHFGENYVQELVDKSAQLPKDIQWHFIGHLQSNKAKTVVSIPNLYVVETVDNIKKANTLNKACDGLRPDPLRVYVQVNTSNEEAKSGVAPADCVKVCQHIIDSCPRLELSGLMTIGMFGRDPSEENPDFKCLAECKNQVEQALPGKTLELSMGMSEDYVQAMRAGSTNVRVGRTIFGERERPQKKE